MLTIYYKNARDKNLKQISSLRKGSWVHLVHPTESELEQVAKQYNLDLNALKDSTDIYEAPRVETDKEAIYIFTRYGYPPGAIATEPLLVAITNDNVITVMRHPTAVLDRLLDGSTDVVTTMKTKLLLQVLSAVSDSYRDQLNTIARQLLSFRAKLKKHDIDNEVFIKFIDIEEDLNEFLNALVPQKTVLQSLGTGKVLPLYEDDKDLLEDIELSTSELIEITKSRLKTINNTREAYSTIMANNLNRIFKRLTSIAIFMSVPTIVGGLYGMNVALPLENNPFAFWIVLSFVGLLVSLAIWIFDRKKWL
jgi:magnesium transporter